MTMHKLTAGDGYQYLIRQVAAVDSTSRGKAPLIDYYSSKGESPGHWVGSGLASLESTGARWVPESDVADVWAVEAGSQVSEAQMKALFGEGLHPNADAIAAYVTERGVHGVAAVEATKLGRQFYIRDGETTFARALAVAYRDHNEEVGAHWNAPIDAPTRAAIRTVVARRKFAEQYGRAPADDRELTGYIARETRARTTAVAGYDLTFSPVKSVSALWAIAPMDVAAVVEECHDAAVADALKWLETHAAFTRSGTNGVAQVDTTGLARRGLHPPRLARRRPRSAHPRRDLQQGRHRRCQRRHALAGPRRPARAPVHRGRLRAVQHPPGSPPRAATVAALRRRRRPRAATNARSAKSSACPPI